MIRRVLFGIMLAALTATAPATAASWLEKTFWMSGPRYDSVLPPCQDGEALNKIATRFAEKEAQFWNSNLRLVEFERVREIALRPWGGDTIPRRFCSAVVIASDGRKRPVYFSIVEDGGMIGMTWGVEWCVVGLDRNWAYNPACKMARP